MRKFATAVAGILVGIIAFFPAKFIGKQVGFFLFSLSDQGGDDARILSASAGGLAVGIAWIGIILTVRIIVLRIRRKS